MKMVIKCFFLTCLVFLSSIYAATPPTLDLISDKPLPSVGIISAHPGRVERIAKEFLQDVAIHTDYRGYKIYTGYFQGKPVFAAYTAMGGPSVAMILENLIAAGAKKIIRVGTSDNDSCDQKKELNRLFLLSETRGLKGMMEEYGFSNEELGAPISSSSVLTKDLFLEAKNAGIEVELAKGYSIDAYHVYSHPERFAKNAKKVFDKIAHFKAQGANVRDMESGTLFMISYLRGVDAAAILIPRVKNNIETQDYEKTTLELEGCAIQIALKVLVK